MSNTFGSNVRKKYNYNDSDVPPLLPMDNNGRCLQFSGSLIDSPMVGCQVIPEYGFLLNKFGSFSFFSSVDEDKTLMMPFCSQPSNMVNIKDLPDILVDGSRHTYVSGFRVVPNFDPQLNLMDARNQKRTTGDANDPESDKFLESSELNEEPTADGNQESSSTSASSSMKGSLDLENLMRPVDEDVNEFLKRGRADFPNMATKIVSDRKDTQMILLAADESYFLAYFGFLTVADLTTSQLYQHFNKSQCCFPHFFAAYYHYRTTGWVVRPGHTFGCHFLLYKHGPAFNHSSHGVFVTVSSSNTPQTNDVTPKCTFCDSSTGTPKKVQCCSLGYELSVAQVCALSRSLGSSKKTLVLCNINACQRVSAENFDTSNFEITEQNLSRWIPGNPV